MLLYANLKKKKNIYIYNRGEKNKYTFKKAGKHLYLVWYQISDNN